MYKKNLCKYPVSQFVVSVILITLLSGCGSTTGPKIRPTDTEKPMAIPTSTREKVTLIPPAIPSPTTAYTYFDYKKVCLPITSSPEIDDKSSGLILGEVLPENPGSIISLLDLSNQTESRLFGKNEITGLRESPDKFWIAYAALKDQIADTKLVFRNLAADKIIEIPWGDGWSFLGIQ